jgi:hypothetical protein
MEIKGNVLKVGAIQSGTNQAGREWRSQEVVVEFFETPEQMWSQKIVINLRNEQIEGFRLSEGDKVRVRFGLNYSEYNGRFYQRVALAQDGLTLMQRMGEPSSPQQPTEPTKQEEPKQEEKQDELPF